ncbi:MAG: hypothetical protein II393_03740 [Cytophagales bacterium]|nr:hypothetical protein [Cytophagales bacterium]
MFRQYIKLIFLLPVDLLGATNGGPSKYDMCYNKLVYRSNNVKFSDILVNTLIYKLLPFSLTFDKNNYFFFGSSQGIAYFPKALRLKKDLRIGFLLLAHRTYTIIPNIFYNLEIKCMLLKTNDIRITTIKKFLAFCYGFVIFPLSIEIVIVQYKCLRLGFLSLVDILRLCYMLTTKTKNMWAVGNQNVPWSVLWLLSPHLLLPCNDKDGPKDFTKDFQVCDYLLFGLYILIPKISIDISYLMKKNSKTEKQEKNVFR